MPLIQPDNRPIGERMYLLCATYRNDEEGLSVTVPAGFVNDGASVPRFAWSIIGLTPDGLIRGAAVSHDYEYRFKITPRVVADKRFYKTMLRHGVKDRRARIAYGVVRMFGKKHYGSITPPETDDHHVLHRNITALYKQGVIDTKAYNFAIAMINAFE